jgi:hypothetical protein
MVGCFFGISLSFYHTTRRNIREDIILHSHCPEKPKSQNKNCISSTARSCIRNHPVVPKTRTFRYIPDCWNFEICPSSGISMNKTFRKLDLFVSLGEGVGVTNSVTFIVKQLTSIIAQPMAV